MNNAGWKAIKANALILAEGGNLLLLRQLEKDAKLWQELCVQVPTLASDLYQSGSSLATCAKS